MSGRMKLYNGLLVLAITMVGGGLWFLFNPILRINGSDVDILPCSPLRSGDERQVEIIDAFCTYSGDSSRFLFRFTLNNLQDEDSEVSYIWSLNDPLADESEY